MRVRVGKRVVWGFGMLAVVIAGLVAFRSTVELRRVQERILSLKSVGGNRVVESVEEEELLAQIERCRAEIQKLKAEKSAEVVRGESAGSKDELAKLLDNWLGRIDRLSSFLSRNEAYQIPEMSQLTALNWLEITNSGALSSEADFRIASARLREKAKLNSSGKIFDAMRAYLDTTEGKWPEDLREFGEYLDASVDPSVFDRFQISTVTAYPGMDTTNRFKLVEVKRVDEVWDSVWFIDPNGAIGLTGSNLDLQPIDKAIDKYEQKHGSKPESGQDIARYVPDPRVKKHIDEIFRAMNTPVEF